MRIKEPTFVSTRFDPWVGARYFRGNPWGGRLLVLGESHYSGNPREPRSLTGQLTREYAEGKWKHRYWTCVAQLVVGRALAEDDGSRKEFWDSVAFYNFIPAALPAHSTPPSLAQWEAGEKPLMEVIEKLRPTWMLVTGKRLWENLPGSGQEGPTLSCGRNRRQSYLYKSGGHSVLSSWVLHPRFPGFSWSSEHRWASSLMRLGR